MALFGKISSFFGKISSFLGVDLGATSIKLVELQRKAGRPHLVTYGYAEPSRSDIVRDTSEETVKRTADLLKELCKKAKAKSRKAITGLPHFSVFSSLVNLPAQSKERLIANIKREAAKVIPVPLDQVILDWKILGEKKPEVGEEEIKPLKQEAREEIKGEIPKKTVDISWPEKPGRTVSILLTAAPKDLVARYLKVFKEANLELLSLETEGFALARALVGRDPSRILIVDISATTCDMILVKKGLPVFGRTVNVGGISLTEALAKSLGMNIKEAEQFKRDLAARGGLSQVLKDKLAPVVHELEHLISRQKERNAPVEKVILSGGTAFLAGLAEFLAEKLEMKVIVGNAWDRISYPADLKPVLEDLAPRFAVAIGLALRED